ncbi:hypothetical protein COU57_03350 [Candidatus Pacearchaeota archaeon CG10_big_fil_rev_8_21_14_0_10_32_14]|nr:MAG: hypothetical protein COU57_03350 [Candidatus Pacearchaeota archaeon CG10_big_fil_rev_8_21_14_0_10_32_14]
MIDKNDSADLEKEISPDEHERLKKKSLNYSIVEGSFASVSNGAGEQYLVPYALALNANNAQVGFLSSFVGFIGASSQILGSKLMFKYSRKKLIVTFVFLQAAMWLVVLSLGLLYLKGALNSFYAVTLLILFYTIYSVFGSLAGPPWFSLLGDLAPEKGRGKYFSKRNRINGSVAMIAALIASFFLDYMKELGLVIIGFVILFAISCLGRFLSGFIFTKHYYPKLEMKKEHYFSFRQFIKKAPGNNYGKFVIFVGMMNIFVHFSGPFFTVYMLEELHYSYLWFTLVNLAGSLFTILSIPFWGEIGDRYGNRTLLVIGSLIVPIIPIFWLFSGNPIYLILTAQLASGIGWAAFNLGASNFIYDSVTPQRRGLCVSYYNMINGISIFIGAMAGGLVAQYVHLSFMNVFLFIFLISGIGRAIVSLTMLRKIKEVRTIEKSENLFGEINLFMTKPLQHFFRGAYAIVPEVRKKEVKNK